MFFSLCATWQKENNINGLLLSTPHSSPQLPLQALCFVHELGEIAPSCLPYTFWTECSNLKNDGGSPDSEGI